MRLRQIEVFHAIYSSGSMTNAAALLNVSQPSISKVLAHAEQQLGFTLFERNKGKLIPTPEAEQLIEHVTDAYQTVDRLRHVAHNLRAATRGRVRIAGTPAFSVELLPLAISAFAEAHPDVVFEIETLHMDNIVSALLDSRVDLGVAFDPVARPGIEVCEIARSRFVVMAPRNSRFEDRDAVSISDLSDQRFIGLNNRGPLGQLLSTRLAASGVDLNVVAWTDTYHVAKALVARGAGVCIADEITARSSLDDEVTIVPLEPEISFAVSTIRNADTPLSLIANHFVDQLRLTLDEFLRYDPDS